MVSPINADMTGQLCKEEVFYNSLVTDLMGRNVRRSQFGEYYFKIPCSLINDSEETQKVSVADS